MVVVYPLKQWFRDINPGGLDMKLAHKGMATTAEMDMSPMIDMVFLLLIFFLVASHVVDAKPHVDIPESTEASIPNDITDRLMISVNLDGDYFLGNEDLPASLDVVSVRIAAEMAGSDNLQILIRADAKVPYEANERIMKVCADHGANNLIFSTYQQ